MRVYEISNYLNEELILDIKSENNKKFVNEFHVVESNTTYRYNKKRFNLKKKYPHIFHHKMDGINLFYKPFPRLKRDFPFIDFNKYSWMNEKVQRDYLLGRLNKINDDDVIIVSDLDEIIDFNFFDEIKFFVKKKGIITLKFYQTMYYFNLFSFSQNNGPDEWAYRTFVMTGKYFKKIKSIEKLRILGAANKLTNEVYCLKKKTGFHHSWILENDDMLYKLKNYSHAISEHAAIKEKKLNKETIASIVNSKQNIIEGNYLETNSKIKLLPAVANKKKILPYFFV